MPNRYSFSVLTPKSTAISAVSYDADTFELSVTFRSGQTWVYENVPGVFARGLRDAKSKGRYYYSNIKGAFTCSPVPAKPSDCDENLTEALQASLAAVRS